MIGWIDASAGASGDMLLGAVVGAGSVITEDVEADALAVERSDQRGVAGWARRFRERMTGKAAE